MAKEHDSKYSVGYKKPPQHTRFKPGQSGNKRGRPKTEKAFGAVLCEQLRSPIGIVVRGKRKKISTLEGILKRLTQMALEGNPRAATMLLKELNLHGGKSEISKLDALLQVFREDYERTNAKTTKPESDEEDQ